MAKFFGVIGFGETKETSPETSPGVFKLVITEKSYSGDVLRNSQKIERGQSLNDEVNVDVKISVIANEFALQHISAIRYVKWMGVLWKVTSFDPQRPRLILTIGGVYNGPTL